MDLAWFVSWAGNGTKRPRGYHVTPRTGKYMSFSWETERHRYTGMRFILAKSEESLSEDFTVEPPSTAICLGSPSGNFRLPESTGQLFHVIGL